MDVTVTVPRREFCTVTTGNDGDALRQSVRPQVPGKETPPGLFVSQIEEQEVLRLCMNPWFSSAAKRQFGDSLKLPVLEG